MCPPTHVLDPLPSAEKLPAAVAADTKASGSAGTGTAPTHDEPIDAECFGLAEEEEEEPELVAAALGCRKASAGIATETAGAPEANEEAAEADDDADDGDVSAVPFVECCCARNRPAECRADSGPSECAPVTVMSRAGGDDEDEDDDDEACCDCCCWCRECGSSVVN